jgi:hypothetical protein
MDLRPAPILPASPRTAPVPTSPPSPITPAQVWPLLSLTQQQILFASLVRACRSLLPAALAIPPQPEEQNHE